MYVYAYVWMDAHDIDLYLYVGCCVWIPNAYDL